MRSSTRLRVLEFLFRDLASRVALGEDLLSIGNAPSLLSLRRGRAEASHKENHEGQETPRRAAS